MEKDILIKELDKTTEELLGVIESFSQDAFNVVPFEGSWTAGQVAEHIFKSEKGIPTVLKSDTVASDREPDSKVPAIQGIFLNFDKKLNAPEFIIPSDPPHNKEELLASMKTVREKISALASTLDLSTICKDFPFPTMGEFSRYEWLYFAVFHSMRHIRQMKNIRENVMAV